MVSAGNQGNLPGTTLWRLGLRLLGKGHTILPGTFEDYHGGHLAAFEVHGMTAMGRLLVPGNEVVLAVAAIYHGYYDGFVKSSTFHLRSLSYDGTSGVMLNFVNIQRTKARLMITKSACLEFVLFSKPFTFGCVVILTCVIV